MGNKMLKLSGICKSFDTGASRLTVLSGVDLDINEGEMVAIMGKSGSGKSTFMNIVGLLDQADSGDYYLAQRSIQHYNDDELSIARNELIGFVFQSFYLLPRLNAVENVALPLMYRRLSDKKQYQRSMAMLDKVDMRDRATHRPNELSGGQCQRVAIARALVGNPRLILADEPTGALDSRVGKEIMDLFIHLNEVEGITIMIITHDDEVAERCQRTLVMQDGRLHEQMS
jgi:putative ABC transport system ATP-binding protein